MNQTPATSKPFFHLSSGTKKVAFILFQLTALVALSLVLSFFITVLWATANNTSYAQEVHRGTLELAFTSLLALSTLIYLCLPNREKYVEKPRTTEESRATSNRVFIQQLEHN